MDIFSAHGEAGAGYESFQFFLDITPYHLYTYTLPTNPSFHRETRSVTKKEIVKDISDATGLTQLKTKEVVQKTFDAIVETLLEEGRIELRNFGVFEVKRRKARKARNPRTGERVDVGPKSVVTFKPGKEMEEKIRALDGEPALAAVGADSDGQVSTTPPKG